VPVLVNPVVPAITALITAALPPATLSTLIAGPVPPKVRVELEGEPVGVVGLKNIEAERSEYFGYLGEKPLWGQGHGKTLLLFAMNEAKGRGCARVYLRVSRKNERAVRLYRRHNFSVVRETEEVLTMERDV